jgi:hypothetical protein
MYSTTKQWRTGTSVYSRLALWHGDHNIKFKISVRISWFDRIVRGVMTDLKSTDLLVAAISSKSQNSHLSSTSVVQLNSSLLSFCLIR